MQIRDFKQILEVLASLLGAWLQTALHAEHDLAAHFGCDGDKNLSDAVFQFTDIVFQLHAQLYHVRALKFTNV